MYKKIFILILYAIVVDLNNFVKIRSNKKVFHTLVRNNLLYYFLSAKWKDQQFYIDHRVAEGFLYDKNVLEALSLLTK